MSESCRAIAKRPEKIAVKPLLAGVQFSPESVLLKTLPQAMTYSVPECCGSAARPVAEHSDGRPEVTVVQLIPPLLLKTLLLTPPVSRSKGPARAYRIEGFCSTASALTANP